MVFLILSLFPRYYTGKPTDFYVLQEASRIFGLAGKDTAFHKLVTDEQMDLLKDQEVSESAGIIQQ